MAEIMMPQKKQQETSIGRRLIGIAAPIVGGIYGGPMGAAAGSALASKLNGGDNTDALLAGIQGGVSQGASKGGGGPAPAAASGDAMGAMPKLEMPALGESSFGRKISANMQDPQVAIHEGKQILASLPVGDPLRKEYTEPLLRAQMMAKRGSV